MGEHVTICGRDIEVRSLTMRQIREAVAKLKSGDVLLDGEPHIIDLLYDDSVPAVAVSLATGLSLAELAGDIDQVAMRDLLDKVRAANPFFVGMMERFFRETRSDPLSRVSAT